MSSSSLFSLWRHTHRTTLRCRSHVSSYYARNYAPLAHATQQVELEAEPISERVEASVAEHIDSRPKPSPRKPKARTAVAENKVAMNPLEPNGVDLYLASINNAGHEPTVADLERNKPKRHATPGSVEYAEQYSALLETLCQSFTKDQLRSFTKFYELGLTAKLRKIRYAEAIVERQWAWPSLRDIQKQKRERTETSTKSFPLNPSQLFLLLGKDGVDLLQMSTQCNVRINLEQSPLALRARGLKSSLRSFSEGITKLKKSIIEDTFDLPTGEDISKDLLQKVSRLSGAYVEKFAASGKIRICAKDQHSLSNAKRLATRAACEARTTSNRESLSFFPSELPSDMPGPNEIFPRTYSLFPFLSPQSVPWTKLGGTFRLRRVGEWLSAGHPKMLESLSSLAKTDAKTIIDSRGKPIDLKKFLFENNIPEPGHERILEASTGYAMLNTPAPLKATLTPPYKGYWPFEKITSWARESKLNTVFALGLPSPPLELPTVSRQVLQRVVYRAIPEGSKLSSSTPVKVIKLEIDLTNHKARPTAESLADSVIDHDAEEVLRTDAAQNQSEASQLVPRCWVGSETMADLMMPDRPMDLRLSVYNLKSFDHGHDPSELREYVDRLREFLEVEDQSIIIQPEPPLTFVHDGSVYALHTNSSIKRSNKNKDAAVSNSVVSIVAEETKDLESDEKSACYRVTHIGNPSEESWAEFFAGCDQLTTLSYSSA